MKATKIFMMAALALTFAACSNNDDNDFAQQPAEQPANGEITITATLDANDGASTRALSIDGSNIASTWKNTDQFAILYKNGTDDTKSIATVDKIDGTTVTITFTIPASLASNKACTIVYPASAANAANTGADVATALATQDGTIGNCPEVRVGTATIDKDNHSLSDVTKLAAQNAIFKFTVKNADASATIDVNPLTITIGAQDYVITPASATSELYVALPAVSGQAVSFSATGSDSKTYTCSKASVTFAAGKYYQSTLKMTPAVPEYYNKLTKINDNFMDQVMLLKELGRGQRAYNSSLTAAQAYALATYQAAIDGKAVYVIMSSQDDGYEIHYALSTDAAATEHTADLYNICNESNPVRMYYVAQ